jgi:hypothetical protein
MKAITTTILALSLFAVGCDREPNKRAAEEAKAAEHTSQAEPTAIIRTVTMSADAPRATSLPASPLARTLPLSGVQRFASARLGDWSGDGRDELFVVDEDGRLRVAALDGTILASRQVGESRLNMVADTDGDGRVEIFLSARDGTDLVITVLDQQFREVRHFQATGGTHRGRPDSGIRAERVVDLDGDGHLELLAVVGTGYGWKPRGVYCFDYDTGRLRWRHLTGPGVTDVQILDVDADGVLDVVFGTYSPGNGNRESDGTDDMHCYVHAVTGRGKLLWIRPMGGYYTGAYPLAVDLDNDGRQEIVVRVEAGTDFRSEVGQLIRLDCQGRPTARFDAGRTMRSALATDLDNDDRPEIPATDRTGTLYVLGPDLSLVRKVSLGTTEYESIFADLAAAGDLDGDGRPEVVLTYREREFVSGRNPRGDMGPRNVRHFHNVAVLVLDADLREVARHAVAATWTEDHGHRVELRPLGPDGGTRLVSLADRVTLIDYPARQRPMDDVRPLPEAADQNAASLADVRRQLGEIVDGAVETKKRLLKARLDGDAAPDDDPGHPGR